MWLGTAWGQAVKTSYFMDKSIERTALNPAFTPERSYFSIPVLGSVNAGFGTNGLTVGNFLFPGKNGKLVTGFDGSIAADKFPGRLPKHNILDVEAGFDIVRGGWYHNRSFWSYNIGLRNVTSVNIPRSLFEFVKNGSSEKGYNMSGMTIDELLYLEIGVGYARPVNDRLTVGGRLKVLPGLANVRAKFNRLNATLAGDVWSVTSEAELRTSINGVTMKEKEDEQGRYVDLGKFDSKLNPGISGMGAGVDLGASYRLLDNLVLSASVLDLGFINWNRESTETAHATGEVIFNGFDMPVGDGDDQTSVGDQIKDLGEDAKSLVRFRKGTPAARTTALATSLLLGGEYTLLDGKIGFGMLYSTRFYAAGALSELTASTNFQPASWFGASISYSMLRGYNTCGLALNFSPGGFNFFVGTDYIPFRLTPQGIPVNAKGLNLNLGMSVQFGKGPKGPKPIAQ
jgi:hypothetical protein